MVRRKINFKDFLMGAVTSARNGTLSNPLATQAFVNDAHDRRMVRELGSRAIDGATDKAIRKFLEKANSEKRGIQFKDDDVVVKVKSGWSMRYRCPATDIIVADRHDRTGHYHYVVTDDGRIDIDDWREKHR